MSIIINEDKSYMSNTDLLSIEKGIAKLGIHSIKFSHMLTEEQMQENRKMADILSREEWSVSCEKYKIEVGQKIEKIIDMVNDKFIIYQYKNKSQSSFE